VERNVKTFNYQNPISALTVSAIRDCQILEVEGTYYLIGTAAEFFKGPNPGVSVYSSKDLLNWNFEKHIIERKDVAADAWYKDRFWAPELHHINGKFYCTFTCCNEATNFPFSVGVAVSDDVLGPYEIITHDEPLTAGIDLTLFQDDDGKVYAYWSFEGIKGQEIDLESCDLKGTAFSCFGKGKGKEWDSIGIEGSWVLKREGIYYHFYSSWTRGYEIGYATAPHPKGPWKKADNNPFFGAQDKFVCEREGVEYSGDPASPYIAVGHNAIFKGPDGRDWITCHYQVKDEIPKLGFDPIDIKDGKITGVGPTYTPQSVVWS